MGQAGSVVEAKDFSFKYRATTDGKYQQLDAALVGTCIAVSKLSGSAKARLGATDNLAGVTQDGANMYRYLLNNGASVGLYQFQVPSPSGAEIKSKVRDFLKKPGNNKLLYISGHGDSDGDLVVGEGEYLSPTLCMTWLAEARFAGHITFVIDACYAGMWAERVSKMIHKGDRDSSIYGPLRDGAKRRGQKTYINLRLSCLRTETSRDTNNGGRYTCHGINQLRREWKVTPQDGNGWGTKVMVQRKPKDSDCVFGISKDEPQTDLIVDFVIEPDGKTNGHWPSNRSKYLANAKHV